MVGCKIWILVTRGLLGLNAERITTLSKGLEVLEMGSNIRIETGCDEQALAVCTGRVEAHEGSWGISEIAKELSVTPMQVQDTVTVLGVPGDADCATLCRALQSSGEVLLGKAIPDRARSACLDDSCTNEVKTARPCFARAQPGTLERSSAEAKEESLDIVADPISVADVVRSMSIVLFDLVPPVILEGLDAPEFDTNQSFLETFGPGGSPPTFHVDFPTIGEKKKRLMAAVTNGVLMAADAVRTVSQTDALTKLWFAGAESAPLNDKEVKTIRAVLNDAIRVLGNAFLVYNGGPDNVKSADNHWWGKKGGKDGCNKEGRTAYVYPEITGNTGHHVREHGRYKIFLCDFGLSAVQDAYLETLFVHEATHHSKSTGKYVDDYTYCPQSVKSMDCIELAKKSKFKAMHNADNYRGYVTTIAKSQGACSKK